MLARSLSTSPSSSSWPPIGGRYKSSWDFLGACRGLGCVTDAGAIAGRGGPRADANPPGISVLRFDDRELANEGLPF